MSFTNLVLVERDRMSAAGDVKNVVIYIKKDCKEIPLKKRTSPAFKLIYRKLLLKLNSFKPCQFYVYLNHDNHLFLYKHTNYLRRSIEDLLCIYCLMMRGIEGGSKMEKKNFHKIIDCIKYFSILFIFNALCSPFAIVRVR